ncbi:DUF732 domain-containing protein [Mycobacterium sp. 2YAF39]|uniref:DUF732 domain-containing protein n=1 Tax=Mycobacterium sp. 2YAF39 TaxID=3233033 RepID=UPI003F97BDBA
MTTVRRAITVVMVAAGFAVFGGGASVHAQDADEQFEKAVNSLGITAGDETDIPALGKNVCNTMATEMARNPNPPPVVRGIVSSLQNSNLSREQAVGFMQASVAIYCPQFIRYIGR